MRQRRASAAWQGPAGRFCFSHPKQSEPPTVVGRCPCVRTSAIRPRAEAPWVRCFGVDVPGRRKEIPRPAPGRTGIPLSPAGPAAARTSRQSAHSRSSRKRRHRICRPHRARGRMHGRAPRARDARSRYRGRHGRGTCRRRPRRGRLPTRSRRAWPQPSRPASGARMPARPGAKRERISLRTG